MNAFCTFRNVIEKLHTCIGRKNEISSFKAVLSVSSNSDMVGNCCSLPHSRHMFSDLFNITVPIATFYWKLLTF